MKKTPVYMGFLDLPSFESMLSPEFGWSNPDCPKYFVISLSMVCFICQGFLILVLSEFSKTKMILNLTDLPENLSKPLYF